MTQNKINFVFGPIQSRRLGRSLGVSLLPFKTCSMDCIYCECGVTTCLTEERGEYSAPLPRVLEALDGRLKELDGALDYVTFSGVGEPLLHTGVGAILDFVKTRYPGLKTCILTNGSALLLPEVRAEAAKADLVIASLDGSNEEEFRKINRPVPGLTLEKLVESFIAFRKLMKGRFLLEIFIVPGINDSEASAERFRLLAEKIAPDGVEINALDRMGAEKWVLPAEREVLEHIGGILSKSCKVEFIAAGAASGREEKPPRRLAVLDLTLLAAMGEEQLTAGEIAGKTTLPEREIELHLAELIKREFVAIEEKNGTAYYGRIHK